MIRRIFPGSLPPSVPSTHRTTHNHADAASANAAPVTDTATHGPRLRPAPPRRRRRSMGSLDTLDDFDATEQEDAEATRACALRGRVSVAIARPEGKEQHQGDQHGGGGNTHADDPQAGRWQGASPVEVDDSARARIDGVIDRYATTCSSDPAVRRHALAAALVELRAISVVHPATASLTTMVWKLMRAHLHSSGANASTENLQALRKRLIELVAADPEPTPALRNFHLLLPLILLNAEKPRRRVDRATAITRLNTLLIEHPERATQEVRA
ncbi:hypothetical protein [Xanthomonas vasicola]|uniref:hypothetical protein n=1 Tax=Xanthomonas vasicola TaxID=56459 RepID=UPI000531B090|nr:hypothetical protein [Xanthomonas vasicola]AZR33447.1 4-hydroxyphenylacetate catabolism regulator HpaA [Xanthomonas vasicola]KGR55298.1 4-hydroxyphenylacetate catabolism regulator HpaA [Xanthomonas vasicola]KGR56815.1 4-hydroxyphenylacetate catabolism regulator HpaA [Xanthomonas vasicola]KGT85296.1 4-hydroxyphenylacetate catabolism regulator HpaA [Xanthomonas vasicola]